MEEKKIEITEEQLKEIANMSPETKLRLLMSSAQKFQALSEEEKTLERLKAYNGTMKLIGELWDALPRRRKRQMTNPLLKFSNRLKRRMKTYEESLRAVKEETEA